MAKNIPMTSGLLIVLIIINEMIMI
jgi:hypothetical protein